MIGYKLNIQQKDLLMGNEFAPNQYFNPVQDINGDYFIFDGEVEGCVNEEFMCVKSLPQVEFISPINNDI